MQKKHLLIAINSAIESGIEIIKHYKQPLAIEIKKDNTPVTIADKIANNIILGHLKSTALPIISEEENLPPFEKRKTWEKLWLVDPIDGTKGFIAQNDEFTVNIALIENQKPLLGVIYIPTSNTLFFAQKNIGCFKISNVTSPFHDINEAIQEKFLLKKEINKSVYVIATSSSYNKKIMAFVNQKELEKGKVKILKQGSSLKFCQVAEGIADIYPRYNPCMEWDTAAAQIIIEESGGELVDATSKTPLVYNKSDLHNPPFLCFGQKQKHT